MTIEEQLTSTLKDAMRAKDQRTLDVVRMLKSRVQERRTAKGFSGDMTDDIVREVVSAYRRQIQKALEEFERAGERGAEQTEKLRFEIAFCERFLPAMLAEDDVRALVRQRIDTLAITDPKQIGRLVGDIMKSHRGQVDAAIVKRLAEELLG